MTILDQLAAHARERVAADQAENSLDVLQQRCRALGRGRGARFRSALETPELSFICEVKKASPSKGVIAKNFPYLDIARDYERAGADAISCLTEPKWFFGLRPDFHGNPWGGWTPPCSARTSRWTPTSSTRRDSWGRTACSSSAPCWTRKPWSGI